MAAAPRCWEWRKHKRLPCPDRGTSRTGRNIPMHQVHDIPSTMAVSTACGHDGDSCTRAMLMWHSPPRPVLRERVGVKAVTFPRRFAESFAALLEVGELIVTGKPRTQQNHVAGRGDAPGRGQGGFQVAAVVHRRAVLPVGFFHDFGHGFAGLANAQHRFGTFNQGATQGGEWECFLSDPPTICTTFFGGKASSPATAASGPVAMESFTYRTPSISPTISSRLGNPVEILQRRLRLQTSQFPGFVPRQMPPGRSIDYDFPVFSAKTVCGFPARKKSPGRGQGCANPACQRRNLFIEYRVIAHVLMADQVRFGIQVRRTEPCQSKWSEESRVTSPICGDHCTCPGNTA